MTAPSGTLPRVRSPSPPTRVEPSPLPWLPLQWLWESVPHRKGHLPIHTGPRAKEPVQSGPRCMAQARWHSRRAPLPPRSARGLCLGSPAGRRPSPPWVASGFAAPSSDAPAKASKCLDRGSSTVQSKLAAVWACSPSALSAPTQVPEPSEGKANPPSGCQPAPLYLPSPPWLADSLRPRTRFPALPTPTSQDPDQRCLR